MSHLTSVMRGRTVSTPQTKRALPNQVKNNAGGYVFKVDDWLRLDRFLFIGTEGGTFYASEKDLTSENASHIAGLVKADSMRVATRVLEISKSGRAYKNDYAIFVFAMVAGWGSNEAKRFVFANLPNVARTGAHLLQFVKFSKQFRGWGRAMVNGISHWYLEKSPQQILFQGTKYAQRQGWSQRDVLRLAHPFSDTSDPQNAALAYLAGKATKKHYDLLKGQTDLIVALEAIKEGVPQAQRASFIRDFASKGLQTEHVPTEWLKDNEVWEALAENMPLTSTIRKLGAMTARGLITERSNLTKTICDRLGNDEAIKNARVHPMQLMTAALTYKEGQGEKGSLTWVPSHRILLALDEAFYLAYKNVVPTNKRILLAIDFSGSMTMKRVHGVPNLDARTAAMAMSLIQVNTEPNHEIIAFSSVGYGHIGSEDKRAKGFWPVAIKPGQSLDQVMKYVQTQPGGGTDGTLPIQYALENRKVFDAIITFTDNETWAGQAQVHEVMDRYRRELNPNCKHIVVGLTATGVTQATPDDNLTLDTVGFDAALPQVINAFIAPEV